MAANVETVAAPIVRRRSITITVPAIRAAALLPAAVYLTGQAVTFLMVWYTAHVHHRGLYGLLVANWDGKDFLGIAAHGYSHSVKAGGNDSVAFFPGYPVLLRGLHDAMHLSVGVLSVIVSITAGVVFAYGLTRLVDDRRVGLMLVALAAVSPMSVVLMMSYSEALFCALAVWALVYMGRGNWLVAGALTCAAGAVRQTGVALVAALAVAIVLARPPLREAWRALAGVAVAPLGALAYLGWADHHTGVRLSWFKAEKNGWNAKFDFGHQAVTWTYRQLIYGPQGVWSVAVIAALVAAVFLLVCLIRTRTAVLATYAGMVVALDVLSAGTMNSKVRLLIPAFPLLIPVAKWIMSKVRIQAGCAFAGYGIVGMWFGAYMLTMFGYGI